MEDEYHRSRAEREQEHRKKEKSKPIHRSFIGPIRQFLDVPGRAAR